jgi:hypothetical protein
MDVDSDPAASSKPTQMDLEEQARRRHPPLSDFFFSQFGFRAMVVTVLRPRCGACADGHEGEGEGRGGEREGRGARGLHQ